MADWEEVFEAIEQLIGQAAPSLKQQKGFDGNIAGGDELRYCGLIFTL